MWVQAKLCNNYGEMEEVHTSLQLFYLEVFFVFLFVLLISNIYPRIFFPGLHNTVQGAIKIRSADVGMTLTPTKKNLAKEGWGDLVGDEAGGTAGTKETHQGSFRPGPTPMRVKSWSYANFTFWSVAPSAKSASTFTRASHASFSTVECQNGSARTRLSRANSAMSL